MSVKKKMLFDKGDRIQWTVSSTGYLSQSGQLTINKDTTINIDLVRPKIIFSWDGGGTKTVWFGNKEVTSRSPIYLRDDGPITDIDNVFHNDSTTKNVFLDAEGFPNKELALYGIFNDDTNTIENIEIINSSHIADFTFVFANMQHIKTVSVDTSSATIMENMFAKSAIVNAPDLNTSNVTSTMFMFFDCSNLEHIPLYDFSNVQNMHGTFVGCTNLTNIPQINTSNVTNMSYCFQNCTSLTAIPQINTSNVQNMWCMLLDCTSLTTIPQINTSNVQNMISCFSGCTKLTSVPLLDFSKVEKAAALFADCTSLTDVGGFTGLKTDINFEDSPLTHDSALNVIDNLAVSSGHTIMFKKTTFDTLTPADIAKATSKGWTIMGA